MPSSERPLGQSVLLIILTRNPCLLIFFDGVEGLCHLAGQFLINNIILFELHKCFKILVADVRSEWVFTIPSNFFDWRSAFLGTCALSQAFLHLLLDKRLGVSHGLVVLLVYFGDDRRGLALLHIFTRRRNYLESGPVFQGLLGRQFPYWRGLHFFLPNRLRSCYI